MEAIWGPFKQIIFEFLRLIEGYVGDWGLAIVVLTILVRLALMPLTIRQTKSMYELQRIQPKIKELQKKYADDKEKLQEETLKFYQEHKVNPFGGCLPMLLQMPLLLALYSVLGRQGRNPGVLMQYLESQNLQGTFFSLIPDIARTPGQMYADAGWVASIPYVLLVLIFGLSVWLPQALMPGEKQTKMIGAYMGVVMLWFGWSAPAGVLLYWDVSSIWQVAQQQLMMASLKRHHGDDVPALEAAPVAKTGPKPKKASKKK